MNIMRKSKVVKQTVSDMNNGWVNRGPLNVTGAQTQNVAPNNNIAGAINTVWAHPSKDILIIGAVNGGIWKTTNTKDINNIDWVPKTDEFGISIADIKSDINNDNRLVAVSGYVSSFHRDGVGSTHIYISEDMGENWKTKEINIDLSGIL
jgi:hypothetical protein